VADAYVYQSSPTTNYGNMTVLRADGSPIMRSYLRFNVQGVTGTITRVTLRIFANSASTTGYTIGTLNNNSWTETGINYNNSPVINNNVGTSGRFSAGVWTTVDLTSLVTGNGTVNLGLFTTNTTAISFASLQAGASAPQLVIEVTP
jgi:acid phosphatase type 7